MYAVQYFRAYVVGTTGATRKRGFNRLCASRPRQPFSAFSLNIFPKYFRYLVRDIYTATDKYLIRFCVSQCAELYHLARSATEEGAHRIEAGSARLRIAAECLPLR